MQVIKFGGSSVQDASRIKQVIEIIKTKVAEDANCAVVVSAFGGVTDLLYLMAKNTEAGQDFQENLEQVKNLHSTCLKELNINDQETTDYLNKRLDELDEKLNGVRLLKELTNKALDYVLSTGEKLSARIIAEACKQNDLPASFLNASELILTDSSFGSAKVQFEETNRNIEEYFTNNPGLHVVTGFIAQDANGETTTLGRGGSDYTAAIFGTALKSKQIEIWTDVDGIYTANPKHVIKAFPQEYISFPEAMELAHFGAKVIYPPAIQPALNQGIPIIVKNTFNPNSPGTVVGPQPPIERETICGISSLDQISLLRLEGSGMIGIVGSASRLFSALAAQKINIILITQASSEHSICFAVKPEDAELAQSAVNEEFSLEIKNNLIKPVIVEYDLSIVSVVGENMNKTIGVAGKTFGALGKNGINIVAIAQGSTEFNISAVVSRKDQIKALKALHEEFFFPDTKAINVCIVGAGLIGSELLEQIKANSTNLESSHGHLIRVIGLANSKKMIFNEEGIDPDTLSKDLLEQGETADLNVLIKKIKNSNLPNTLFVDCTASNDIADQYLNILRSNISIVTPNKRAQTGEQETYQSLKKAASKRGVSFLYETSVGAGLPVISTLDDLLLSGDQIIKIEAVLSGTLSYIFNSFTEDKLFSDIVLEARKAGFTEPDPRDDLNGVDVARKILILAREAGYQLELDQVEIENLVPEDCRETESIDKFFELLKTHDQYFTDKIKEAKKQNGKLCYVATFDNGKANVSLNTVTSDHPFYNLSGSDNIIAFTTNRYKECPLVVKGPGAGAGVTAAGVFADIIRLAAY